MKLQRLIALSAAASFALAPMSNAESASGTPQQGPPSAQSTAGPMPTGTPEPTTGPLLPGGVADAGARSRLSKIGSIIGIDGGLFLVTVGGLVAISNNSNSNSSPSTPASPASSTPST